MSIAGESPSTPISAILTERVPPSPVCTPRTSITGTPLTPASWVVQPPTSTNVAGTSGGVVTGIPSVPFSSPYFAHTAQSGPVESYSFVHGFPWNGVHIPPSTPYVGPTPAYVGVQFGNTTLMVKVFKRRFRLLS